MADKQVILTDPSTGDRLFPIVSADDIFNSDGTKLDLSSKADISQVGNLHVWRRTKTVSSPVPAGYTLGPLSVSGSLVVSATGVAAKAVIQKSSSVSVSDSGEVSLVSPTRHSIDSTDPNGFPDVSGQFIYFEQTLSGASGGIPVGNIVFVSSGGSLSSVSVPSPSIVLTEYQTVTGTPAIPAGTHADYPVSVNPNAYQPGSDAKPAGYVVNDVIVKNMRLGDYENGYGLDWRYSDGVIVGNDGTLSLSEPTNQIISSGNLEAFEAIKGKFAFVRGRGSDFNPEEIYFFPSDANIITITTPNAYQTAGITKYQTVTGYPAIPAGTTIEYLGQLGDKSRMQIVSYVGTGNYGSGNPCSINADFPIRLLTFLGQLSASGSGTWSENAGQYASNNVLPVLLTETPQSGVGFSVASRSTCTTYASKDKKTVIWYNSSASLQLNESGREYYFLCQG